MILGIDASQANRRQRTGTEWYAYYLIREFKKILGTRPEVRVKLYTRDIVQADLSEDLPGNFGVKILRWPLPYFWAQLRLSAEMFANPPDIMFSPAHTIPIVHPKKTYTTLHDVGFLDHPELYDQKSLSYHRFAAKLAIEKAFHIFTVSEYSKSRILEHFQCPDAKITVTPLAYDKQRFKPLSEKAVAPRLKKYNLDYKQYLLYLGRLDPKKNILGLIKGYAIVLSREDTIPDLVIAGQKFDIRDAELYLKTRPFLAERIRFLGYVSETDKAALYNGARIFLFPTLYEGFGLPILEAQACGVPVITSNTTSNPEIGQGAIPVDPRKPEEIAGGIQSLLLMPELEKSVTRYGLENVRRFDWTKTAETTLKAMGLAS